MFPNIFPIMHVLRTICCGVTLKKPGGFSSEKKVEGKEGSPVGDHPKYGKETRCDAGFWSYLCLRSMLVSSGSKRWNRGFLSWIRMHVFGGHDITVRKWESSRFVRSILFHCSWTYFGCVQSHVTLRFLLIYLRCWRVPNGEQHLLSSLDAVLRLEQCWSTRYVTYPLLIPASTSDALYDPLACIGISSYHDHYRNIVHAYPTEPWAEAFGGESQHLSLVIARQQRSRWAINQVL